MAASAADPYESLFSDSPPREPDAVGESSSGAHKRKEASSGFEMETAEEMDDFLYYQFFNVNDDDVTKASNGWQLENVTFKSSSKKPDAAGAERSFTGRVALNSDAQLERMGCRAHNAFVLEGEQFKSMIFYGMKDPVMPYFIYTFTASKGDRPGARGRDIYFVRPQTLKWKPLPMSPMIARHVFEHQLPGKGNAALRLAMLAKLAHVPPGTLLDMPALERMLYSHPLEAVRLRNMGIIKRIFFHAKLEALYPYYHVRDVEHLSVEAITTLHRFVTTPSTENNPIALCFVKSSRNLGLRCQDFDRIWALPELTHVQYEHICAAGKFVPPPTETLAVKLYDQLRSLVARHGHKFVDDDILSLYVAANEKALFEPALALLSDTYKAITIELLDGGPVRAVYVARMHMCERIILSGLEVVIARFVYEPPPRASPESVAKYPLRSTHPLCSEQKLFVEMGLSLPITVLTGPAGAGKSASLTEFLAHVGAIDYPKQVVFATYQGTNAATAADTNTPFAMTAHRILAKHANKCAKSPCVGRAAKQRKTDDGPKRGRSGGVARGRGAGNQRQMSMSGFVNVLERPDEEDDDDDDFVNCPLEDVLVLVIDEIGLFYEELFAPLLHVLTTCGKLCQIVVCGDQRQMVQIQPGQLQKDLIEGFAPWTINYEHQHRFDDESAVIFRHNSLQIDAGRPKAIHYAPGIFERFTPARRCYRSAWERQQAENELVDIFTIIKFSDTVHCMGVTRTHEDKELMLRALERVQFGKIIPYALRVGQKVMATRTIYPADITARQVLMLEEIQDCRVPHGRTIYSLEEREYRHLEPIHRNALNTVEYTKPYGLARRLMCRVVGSTKIVYLPYDGQFKGRVVRAGAVTERACQGTQADHIFVFKPTFWKEADVKECCYVVTTRQRKRLTLFCHEDVIINWVRNPAPRRNSVLGKKIRALYDKFERVLSIPPTPPHILALKEEEGDMYTVKVLSP